MNNKNKNKEPVRVIAVASGKGGVGKTNLAVNLSMAMSNLGKEVTLFDADLGLANVDVLLGLHPLRNLSHVIQQECELKDIVIRGPADIRVVPAASGVQMMSRMTDLQHAALIRAFDDLVNLTDVLVIDTSAGLVSSVLSFCAAAQEVMILVCNEPASIADAYALIKVLHRDYQVRRFRVVVNMADSREEGHKLFSRLVQVCDSYLNVVLDLNGIIPRDKNIIKAVQCQQPILQRFPSSPAAEEIRKIARLANKWPLPVKAQGKIEFFLEQLLESRSQDQARATV